MSKTRIFDDFKSSAEAEWLEAAKLSLKGKPVEPLLESATWEGIRRRAIYHEPDRGAAPEIPTVVPGGAWLISQELNLGDPEDFNEALLKLLARGQGVVNVVLEREGSKGLRLNHLDEMSRAFEGVLADAVGYRFSGASGMATLGLFAAWLERKKADRNVVFGCLGLDPLSDLAQGHSLKSSWSGAMDELATCAHYNKEKLPQFRASMISTVALHEAGSHAVVELAAMLGGGLQVVRELCARGLSVSEAASQVAFTLAVGPDFFMEIAKFRAARLLWTRIIEELGGEEGALHMRLHARTGQYNKTCRQPHTNLVRATSESLSAVLGGADSLCVGSFDESSEEGSEFSRRIATNMQLVLQEECGLGVMDPAGGSYYIEALTSQICEEAWNVFREIEGQGGYLTALSSGLIARKIEETHQARTDALVNRRSSLVGVNCYADSEERPKAGLGADTFAKSESLPVEGSPQESLAVEQMVMAVEAAVAKAQDGASSLEILLENERFFGGGVSPQVQALPSRRLAGSFEQLFSRAVSFAEERKKPLRMTILRLGGDKGARPKAEFVKDFFGVSGFQFEEISLSLDPEGLLEKASRIASEETLVVCAGPEVPDSQMVELLREFKRTQGLRMMLVAMKPSAETGMFLEAGADGFVFRGCDSCQMNFQVLEAMGMKL